MSTFAQNPKPQVKLCQIEKYEQCFQYEADPQSAGFRNPSRGFVLFHEKPTGQAAVLVHGLTDSPYIMKDIASVLYRQGYDVYSVLLTGHGTQAEDLFTVTKEQWQRDLQTAVAFMAPRSATGQVLLAGFSMGGALITAEALQRPEAYQGLVYFAPAIRLADPLASLTCLARFVKKWAANGDQPETAPWRYNRLPMNAVCQLYKLTDQIKDRSSALKIPIWSVLATGDGRIDIAEVLDFVKKAKNPKNISRVIENSEIQHADTPLRLNDFNGRSNPAFSEIEADLIQFLHNLN